MELRERAALVGALSSAISTGESAHETVPSMLCQVLTKDAWLHFITRFDEEVKYERTPEGFREFVTTKRLKGLETTLPELKQLIEHDNEALSAYDEMTTYPSSLHISEQYGVDTINTIERPNGTSKSHALRTLRAKRPDLLDRVKSGELSPHKAMREAGFRPLTMTVTLDSPRSAASLIAKASPEFLEELRRLLSE